LLQYPPMRFISGMACFNETIRSRHDDLGHCEHGGLVLSKISKTGSQQRSVWLARDADGVRAAQCFAAEPVAAAVGDCELVLLASFEISVLDGRVLS